MNDWNINVIGREAERKAFRDAARELIRTDTRGEKRPIVMLLWGVGGIGKSTMTRQFMRIAQREHPFERDLIISRLDWEEAPSRIKVPLPDPEVILEYMADHLDWTFDKGKSAQGRLSKGRDVKGGRRSRNQAT